MAGCFLLTLPSLLTLPTLLTLSTIYIYTTFVKKILRIFIYRGMCIYTGKDGKDGKVVPNNVEEPRLLETTPTW